MIQSYLDAVAAGASIGPATPTAGTPDGGPLLTVTSVRLFDSERRDVREAESGRPLRIEIGYRGHGTLKGLDLSVTIFRDDGVRCVDALLHGITAREGRGTFVLDFPSLNLQGGSCKATVAVYDPARRRFDEFQDPLHSFTVRNNQSTGGLVWMDYSWSMRSEADLARSRSDSRPARAMRQPMLRASADDRTV